MRMDDGRGGEGGYRRWVGESYHCLVCSGRKRGLSTSFDPILLIQKMIAPVNAKAAADIFRAPEEPWKA